MGVVGESLRGGGGLERSLGEEGGGEDFCGLKMRRMEFGGIIDFRACFVFLRYTFKSVFICIDKLNLLN